MNDLRAVANTALRHARTASPHIQRRATNQWLMALAEAWLADHPEDDGEPVTEAWLRSLGYLPDDSSPPNGDLAKKIWGKGETADYGKEPAMHMVVNARDGGIWVEAYAADGDSLCIIEIDAVATRGAVRRLMAALGIPAGSTGGTDGE